MTAQTSKFIFNTIKEFHEEILEDYDANAYGLQQWIECELEPQLFWLNHPHGLISPYAIGDKDTQLARNNCGNKCPSTFSKHGRWIDGED